MVMFRRFSVGKLECCIFGAVFVAVAMGCRLCEWLHPHVYESFATIERPHLTPERTSGERPLSPRRIELTPALSDIDFDGVIQRLAISEPALFGKLRGQIRSGGSHLAAQLVKQQVKIQPTTWLFKITYQNQDPQLALRISELLADECIAHYSRLRESEIRDEITKHQAGLQRMDKTMNTLTETLMRLQNSVEKASGVAAEELKAESERVARDIASNHHQRFALDKYFTVIFDDLGHVQAPVWDIPVLATPEDYVRTPLVRLLDHKWSVAFAFGVLALTATRVSFPRH